MKEEKQNQKGFTLIEMMIVVAIIGMLSTLVIVVVTGARRKANATTAKGHLAQVSKAVDMVVASGCTMAAAPVPGNPIACSDGSETFMQKVPSPPTTALTYDFATGWTSASNYTFTANGFDNGETFTCTNGSCSCSVQNGCKQSD